MIPDILTMLWKEWNEIFLQRGTLRGGVLSSLVIPILILGVFLPWQGGPAWVKSATVPVTWMWLPLFLVTTMIADSFAGERERKTLEALLASRLSDRAILFGKIASAVSYGWGLTLASLALGLVTVNLLHGRGRLLMYPANTVALIVVISFLGSALAASAGVLVSLRAATVRQAQQTLSIALLVVFFGLLFGVQALPAEWRVRFLKEFAGPNLVRTEVIAGAVLAVIDGALLGAAMARFQRARLILD